MKRRTHFRWHLVLAAAVGQCLFFQPTDTIGASETTAIAQARTLTNDEIRDAMIRESIQSYPGPCACPYNLARNGSRCGGRSAYSRPGGHAPLCFRTDISDEMVRAYRARRGNR